MLNTQTKIVADDKKISFLVSKLEFLINEDILLLDKNALDAVSSKIFVNAINKFFGADTFDVYSAVYKETDQKTTDVVENVNYDYIVRTELITFSNGIFIFTAQILNANTLQIITSTVKTLPITSSVDDFLLIAGEASFELMGDFLLIIKYND